MPFTRKYSSLQDELKNEFLKYGEQNLKPTSKINFKDLHNMQRL